MSDRNAFGGLNPHSDYTPMSLDEQEVLDRLISADDFEIQVIDAATGVEWGVVHRMNAIKAGDKIVKFVFTLSFNRPEIAIPVYALDLVLKTRAGILLFQERQSVMQNYQPLMVQAGLVVPMEWMIAIKQMDPKLVKMLKPGAIGLTTAEGNRKLNSAEQARLNLIHQGEAKARQSNLREIAEAKKAKDTALKG